jgi:pentatricopeptide repeat protein
VFKQMHEDRIRPNVVTYNTLVDVYGKTGQWEKAVRVLDDMRDEVGWQQQQLQRGSAASAKQLASQLQQPRMR